MRVLLIAAFSVLCAPAVAQESEAEQRAREIEAVCSKAHCRDARTVQVRQQDGTTFERAVPRLPIVLPNGWITVFAGEEVHIELTVAKGAIRSARAVAKVSGRANTVSFRLRQQAGRADTELVVTNRLPQHLKYTLGMMLPAGGPVRPAPSCPVQTGLTSHETWAEPVFQVVISDLRFLPEDAPLTCGP